MKIFNGEKFCKDLLLFRGEKSQQIFSEEIGINRSTLSLLETGKQIPSLDILNKICDIGGQEIGDYFIEKNNNGLIYLMGSLEESDKSKIEKLVDRIKLKEKYSILARRCNSDIYK